MNVVIKRILKSFVEKSFLEFCNGKCSPDCLRALSLSRRDVKSQHCPDQSVVCPAFSTTNSTCNTYILQVSLSNNIQVPLFGPGVPPGCFEPMYLVNMVLVIHSSCSSHLFRRKSSSQHHWNSSSQHRDIQVSLSS